MKKKFFITWEDHRRSRELASAVGVELRLFNSKYKKGFSHLSNSIKTVLFLIKEKPNVLFVQNPSLILAFVAVFFKPILRYKTIVDRHTNFRLGKKNGVNIIYYAFDIISNFTIKKADLTIVTNDYLSNIVKNCGGTSFVLPDRLPTLKPYKKQQKTEKIVSAIFVIFICTYARDEPYLDVIMAARHLDDNVFIYVTGDYKNKRLPDNIPPNVILTGFLPQEEYDELLNEADIVMDFTSLEWCLVCGGYEAASLCKPLITSDTVALRELYGDAAVYSRHDPKSIANTIKFLINNRLKFQNRMCHFKHKYEQIWNSKLKELSKLLQL